GTAAEATATTAARTTGTAAVTAATATATGAAAAVTAATAAATGTTAAGTAAEATATTGTSGAAGTARTRRPVGTVTRAAGTLGRHLRRGRPRAAHRRGVRPGRHGRRVGPGHPGRARPAAAADAEGVVAGTRRPRATGPGSRRGTRTTRPAGSRCRGRPRRCRSGPRRRRRGTGRGRLGQRPLPCLLGSLDGRLLLSLEGRRACLGRSDLDVMGARRLDDRRRGWNGCLLRRRPLRRGGSGGYPGFAC